ncbi:hypothetical protein [Plastoroseomonas arctica]|uniref:Lipoprotein n=1 Tax=Plastoroseomonas arctica TaxID=1509237 RepID=A0AAF1KUY3_9PROT|nr:hypothetical protein [Plastoroseomonas arctica]MBR0657417.1 hypothetical protein [Plastoroseomonas arctica]
MRLHHGLALAGVMALGACGSETTRTAPCPRITLLRDGADLTRFRAGAGQDLSVMTADARLSGFEARCDFADRGRSIAVDITPRFAVEQGPAGTTASVDLPWFVAVSDDRDTRILDQLDYTTRAAFPPNQSRALTLGERVRLTLPASEVETFNVRVSFRLTAEELAYNRRRGVR